MSVNTVSWNKPSNTVQPNLVQQKVTQPVTVPEKKNVDFPGNPYSGLYHRIHRLTPEQKFDFHFETGTKLKNGATIIKPVIIPLGNVEIKRKENGDYVVRTSASEETLSLSEEELKNTKWLYRGSIKQMDKDRYVIDYSDRDGNSHFEDVDRAKAIEILSENTYYM